MIESELLPSLTLGFFALLRPNEIEEIRHRDVMLGIDNNRPFVNLFHRQSKDNQFRRGSIRTPYGAESNLRPAKAAAKLIAPKKGRYGDIDLYSPNER